MQPERDLVSRNAVALQHTLEVALLHDGSVSTAVAGLGLMSADQWRVIAEATEATLRRPVVTGVARHGSMVWAAIADWPRDADELRRAAQLNQRANPVSTTAEAKPAARP